MSVHHLSEFMKSGMPKSAFNEMKTQGSIQGAATSIASCFDKAFATAGYDWSTVTTAQLDTIDAGCEQSAKQDFARRGGNVQDWDAEKEAAGRPNTTKDVQLPCITARPMLRSPQAMRPIHLRLLVRTPPI